MMGAIVALAADALGEAAKYAVKHPDVAWGVVKSVRAALTKGHAAEADREPMRTQRLTAIASGMAAARANAVQEAKRREARKP